MKRSSFMIVRYKRLTWTPDSPKLIKRTNFSQFFADSAVYSLYTFFYISFVEVCYLDKI